MIQYLISVSICWLVFYLIYILFLERETFFKSNRYYLLSTIIAGLCIPTLHFSPAKIVVEPIVISDAAQFIASRSGAVTYYFRSQQSTMFSWGDALLIIYIGGVVIAIAKMIYGLHRIFKIYQSGSISIASDGVKLVQNDAINLPFSFFSYVFVHPTFMQRNDATEILKHESVHVHAYHTLDILFVELIAVAFWWNPLIYLYRRAIKQTHEFVADYYASQNIDKKNYGHILLGQGTSSIELALTHQFFNSHLKKRLDMLFKEKSADYKRSRYLLLLPVILVMGLLFSCTTDTTMDQEVPQELVTMLDELLSQDYVVFKERGDVELYGLQDRCGYFKPSMNPDAGFLNNYTCLMHNDKFEKFQKYIEFRLMAAGEERGEALFFYPTENGHFGLSSVPSKEKSLDFLILDKIDEIIDDSGYSDSSLILYRYNEEIVTREEIAEIEFIAPYSFTMCFAAMEEVQDEFPLYAESHDAVLSLTVEW